MWPAGPYVVTVAGRELTIGDVYAVHPGAIAINADDAITALDAGEAQGFQVDYRLGMTRTSTSPWLMCRPTMFVVVHCRSGRCTASINRAYPATNRLHSRPDATRFRGSSPLCRPAPHRAHEHTQQRPRPQSTTPPPAGPQPHRLFPVAHARRRSDALRRWARVGRPQSASLSAGVVFCGAKHVTVAVWGGVRVFVTKSAADHVQIDQLARARPHVGQGAPIPVGDRLARIGFKVDALAIKNGMRLCGSLFREAFDATAGIIELGVSRPINRTLTCWPPRSTVMVSPSATFVTGNGPLASGGIT